MNTSAEYERKLQAYLQTLEQIIYELDWTSFPFCFSQYIINAAPIGTLKFTTKYT